MADTASFIERLREGDTPFRLGVLLIPLIYYMGLISPEYTFGDGPELLAAAHLIGVPHPSGYPLWTALAWFPAHVSWPSGYWNTALLLSAVPTAITVALIYDLLRRLEVHVIAALGAALIWGFNDHVIYQATRVEVYALHCMFVAATFWALTRFALEKEMRWAYMAVGAVCLGLANHLTSAFLIIPVVLGLVLIDRKQIIRPAVALKFSIIAVLGASVYLYLPLAAMFNEGRTIAWNDPQTLERFWFHVTGQEYSIFRNFSKAESTIERFLRSHDRFFFPGAIAVALLGLFEWGVQRWKLVVPALLFWVSSVAYIASYTINDIATYYTGMYVVAAISIGFGINWLVIARLEGLKGRKGQVIALLVALLIGAWASRMAYKGQVNAYKEVLAQDMATDIVSKIEGPAIVFTAVDGHSFPLWYEIFVNNPDKGIIPIDRVMFRLENKGWYRDWFRSTYPDITWPTDEVAQRPGWESWIVRNNPNLNYYAMLEGTWRQNGTYPQLDGWHAKLLTTPPEDGQTVRWARHIYMSNIKRIGGGSYMYDARDRFKAGEKKIACVVEWNNNPETIGTWVFVRPDGEEIRVDRHELPAKTGASWEFLKKNDQVPGEWTCRVEVPQEQTLIRKFVIE